MTNDRRLELEYKNKNSIELTVDDYEDLIAIIHESLMNGDKEETIRNFFKVKSNINGTNFEKFKAEYEEALIQKILKK